MAASRHRHSMTHSVQNSILYRNRVLWLVLGLLSIRLVTLWLSPYNLHGDEAQYWAWAQDLDWGYFSKPPMVAWMIAATTALFGDAEWAVRLGSPLLHSATAYLIFLAGRKAFSPRAGFWACAVYILMPAIWVSSMIVSTDVPLLFFWALGLYGWVSLRLTPTWRLAALLGLALGFGMMSKYAMMFFIPPLILAIIFDSPTRKALLGLKGISIVVLAAAILAPNIWWNSVNDFATITHTASNTSLDGKTSFFHPFEFLAFFRDQFGVFGPVPFILLLLILWRIMSHNSQTIQSSAAASTQTATPSLLLCLTCFALTPLIIISVQAFLSRANANWAVSAYPSAAILLGAAALQIPKYKNWLNRGLLAQSLFCSFLLIVSLSPHLVNRLGIANSVKRLRAWPQTVQAIETRFAQGHEGRNFDSILLDHRIMFYDVNYYGLPKTAPIYIWRKTQTPQHHAELTHPFTQQGQDPILLINYSGNILAYLQQDFERLEPLAPIEIDLGGGKRRKMKTWAAYGYNPPARP